MPNTLSLYESVNNQILGVYSDAAWETLESFGAWKPDKNSLIFSVTDQKILNGTDKNKENGPKNKVVKHNFSNHINKG